MGTKKKYEYERKKMNYWKSVICGNHEFSEQYLFIELARSMAYTIDSMINEDEHSATGDGYMSDDAKSKEKALLDKVTILR